MVELSDHWVEGVSVLEVQQHPNADRLELVRFGTKHGQVDLPLVCGKGDWKAGDVGVYIALDSLVPLHHPAFEWLRKRGDGTEMKPEEYSGAYHRVRPRGLRGVKSYGILLHKTGAEVGRDYADDLGILKYEPPVKGPRFTEPKYGRVKRQFPAPEYGMASLRKYPAMFEPGEWVVVTEKIHGANIRIIGGKRLQVGSHRANKTIEFSWWHRLKTWLGLGKRRKGWYGAFDPWNLVAARLKEKLAPYAYYCFYGEIYGPKIQDLNYGLANEEVRWVCFDVLDLRTMSFLTPLEFAVLCETLELPTPPLLFCGEYDLEFVRGLAEGGSILQKINGQRPDHIREGVVVEAQDGGSGPLGRKIAKYVGDGYLNRGEK